jgi:hypothetical protein
MKSEYNFRAVGEEGGSEGGMEGVGGGRLFTL